MQLNNYNHLDINQIQQNSQKALFFPVPIYARPNNNQLKTYYKHVQLILENIQLKKQQI